MKHLSRYLLIAGFALLIFGSKLWLVSYAGSDLPLLDQWDGASEDVFRPWLEGRLIAADVFRAHNEHRIITTKLYVLGLFIANGQWNALVETTANAAIHTACALVLLLLARRWIVGTPFLIFSVVLFLIFALPFSWENTLYGFQVQVYFLILFSLGHIVLSIDCEQFSWRWSVGQLCGVLAVATMASGFFSSVAVVMALGIRFVVERRWTTLQFITALLASILCVAGWTMKALVPGHASLQADSLGQFAWSFLQLLAWPSPALVPVVSVPAVIFLIRRFRERSATRSDTLLFALLCWSILQCAALAYARSGADVLSSRYFDLLSINIALGFVLLMTELKGRLRKGAALIWICIVAGGLVQECHRQWIISIAPHPINRDEQQGHVRAFLQTLDPREFDGLSWPELPYLHGDALLQRLSTKAIRDAMPPSVRRPVQLMSDGPQPPRDLPTSFQALPATASVSTWSLRDSTPFIWRSSAQPATTLPILRFRIAGDLGHASRNLRVVVKSAGGEVTLSSETSPTLRWKTINVIRPDGEWWVEAIDNDPDAWFAFTDPIEVGRLSWICEKLVKHHWAVMLAGGLMLIVGRSLARDRRLAC